jgi:phage shock protein PspC (stress-responsive transcriptional regulator)
MSKRLYKSRERKLAGVCGGIAEYFDIDPTIIRIVWLIFVLCAGTGLVAYIIAAIVMPDQPDNMDNIQ